MGGAQPLAVTMNGGVGLFVEIDRERIERRLRLRYVDRMADSLDEALSWAEDARARRAPLSIAIHGNAAEIHPELARRGVRFDVVTDQTSAHDVINGYVPAGLSVGEAAALRGRDPKAYLQRAYESIAVQMRAMLEFQRSGAILFDYGNNFRREAENAGRGRLRLSGLRARVHSSAVLRRAGPVPLGGALRRPGGHLRDRPRAARGVRGQRATWCGGCSWRGERVSFQGLPARICWLGYGDRAQRGPDLQRPGGRGRA